MLDSNSVKVCNVFQVLLNKFHLSIIHSDDAATILLILSGAMDWFRATIFVWKDI